MYCRVRGKVWKSSHQGFKHKKLFKVSTISQSVEPLVTFFYKIRKIYKGILNIEIHIILNCHGIMWHFTSYLRTTLIVIKLYLLFWFGKQCTTGASPERLVKRIWRVVFVLNFVLWYDEVSDVFYCFHFKVWLLLRGKGVVSNTVFLSYFSPDRT